MLTIDSTPANVIEEVLATTIYDTDLNMTHDKFYYMLRKKAPKMDRGEAEMVTHCLVGGKKPAMGDLFGYEDRDGPTREFNLFFLATRSFAIRLLGIFTLLFVFDTGPQGRLIVFARDPRILKKS